METWNNLVDKFDLLLSRLKLQTTVKIFGRELSPLLVGFALLLVCIGIWAYLEFEGDNKLVGALVSILLAWGVAQLSALGWGDGIGEKPGSSSVNKVSVPGVESVSTENANLKEHSMDDSEAESGP